MKHHGHEVEIAYISEYGTPVFFCEKCFKLIPLLEGEVFDFGYITKSEENSDL